MAGNTSNIGFEKQIWDAACVLRGNIDASEYKSVVLGLIFLKYISDRFAAKYKELVEEGDGFEEDQDEYTAENIFFVPENARWSAIAAAAHTPEIGTVIDDAMRSIEKENKRLKDILPKNFARPELDKRRLGEVVDLFTNIQMIEHGNSKDILGRTYEYCLSKFAEQEGKLAGEFYTPSCVVRTLVEVLQPFNGRVYDPCCGSGGMFVQSAKFIENHGGNINKISVFGQDSNPTTWKMAQMNLAIRGIEADLGKFNADTFFNDCHPQLKADFIMANPPFNLSGWGADKLVDDVRWQYGTPPAGNANFAWLQQKLSIMFRFNRNALKLFLHSPELVIPYLQSQFYSVKRRELEVEKQELNRKLEHYAFDAKMDELTQKSLRLFRAELATRYHWRNNRRCFEKNDFRRNSEEFTREYPVVLSTTYSIKGTLSIDHIYDYLIVDEASQVDLATGVLAFSCARNIVIVGDLKQLPNVLTEDDIRTSDAIWQKYSLDERYRFSTHSLLSSALEIWQDAPVTLLREHYRCHPKIINFCNQKFYHGQLIVMTKDHDEPDVLTMYRTTADNHARGHINQRQIDVIQREVLPRLHQQNFQSIGIITPYRDQVTAIRKQLGDTYEVDTVHKFQGREQDAIILTSVDNVITDFVDDPHMLNVAVSRAVHSLAVITSQDPRNDQTNYGDLTRYIEYNNFEVIQSQVYSVFDMLYQGYAEQRRAYLQKHKRVSEYDSENLMYSVIQEVLSEKAFSSIGCAVHLSLATLVKNYEPLTEEERKYARNPLTHVDFLLFNQMDKQPVLAIEVDGTGFHEAGSKQAERDMKKNSILEKCAVPLLRLRTDGSGEKEKIKNALKRE